MLQRAEVGSTGLQVSGGSPGLAEVLGQGVPGAGPLASPTDAGSPVSLPALPMRAKDKAASLAPGPAQVTTALPHGRHSGGQHCRVRHGEAHEIHI